MKVLYKPFGIAFGLLAGQVSKKIFQQVWGYLDDYEPPTPTTKEARWPKLVGAAIVEGITFKLSRLVVDRFMARGFARLTGTWPGEQAPERE